MRGSTWRRTCGLLLAGTAVLAVTGCTLGDTPVQTAAATGTAPATSWFYDSGTVLGPTPATPRPPTVIGLTPVIPRPGTFTIPRPVPYGAIPTYSPPPAPCGGSGSPRRITPGAVPGVGSAIVSWPADNRAEVVGYRVQAVTQVLVTGAQPVPVMQTAGQPGGCVQVSITLTGLTSGEPYVFWLEEQVQDPTTSVVRFVQVGSSQPVVIG
jgi:hypothetical protein